MEDWIKNKLVELEMTPKTSNWDSISAELDSQKKNKKRFLFILLFPLATICVLTAGWFMYDATTTEIAEINTTEQVAIPYSREEVVSIIDTSRGTKKSVEADRVPVTKGQDDLKPVSISSSVAAKNTDKYETKSDGLFPKSGRVGSKPNTKVGSNKTEHPVIPFVKPDGTDDERLGNVLATNKDKWIHSLKRKEVDFAIGTFGISFPTVDVNALALELNSVADTFVIKNLKEWPSLLIPARVYAEYGRGIYLNNTKTYLDITDNRMNCWVLGIGYKLSPWFDLDMGVAYYKGSVMSYVGNKIVISKGNNSSIGTASPPNAFNNTMDTLVIYDNTLYEDLKDKDAYAQGMSGTLTQSISGYSIPISVSYKVVDYNKFSVKSQLGMTFNLVRDYSYLTYLEEFQLTINNPNESSATVLGSYSLRGGLITEYRLRSLGVFASASITLNKATKISKSILTDGYQPAIGIGVSYYLNAKK